MVGIGPLLCLLAKYSSTRRLAGVVKNFLVALESSAHKPRRRNGRVCLASQRRLNQIKDAYMKTREAEESLTPCPSVLSLLSSSGRPRPAAPSRPLFLSEGMQDLDKSLLVVWSHSSRPAPPGQLLIQKPNYPMAGKGPFASAHAHGFGRM